MQIRTVVKLVDALVNSNAVAAALDPRRAGGPQGAGAISTEIVRTMREQGMVRALTAALRLVQPEHPAASDAVQVGLRYLSHASAKHVMYFAGSPNTLLPVIHTHVHTCSKQSASCASVVQLLFSAHAITTYGCARRPSSGPWSC